MDPLSIVASTITLAEAAAQICEAISRLRHFGELPGKLYVLKTQVSELEDILRGAARDVNEGLLLADDGYEALERLLARTKSQLEDLAEALRRVANTFSGPKIIAISKSVMWIKEKETFEGFQKDIASIKLSLTVMLSASASQNVHRMVLELRRLALLNSNCDSHLSSLMNQQHEKLNDRIDALGKLLLSQSQPIPSRLVPDMVLPAPDKVLGAQVVRFVAPQSLTCRSWCPCACHTKQKLNLTTPTIMQGVLGKMFVGYSGLPLLKERCNFRGCQHRRKAAATLEIWFPSWFVSMNLKLCFTYLPRIGPEFLLSTTTRVSDDALSITFAMEGNIDGLKQLFTSGLAGPRDVSDSRGYTLMRWALYGGMHNYEMVKFLVGAGALVDETSYENVWDFILRGKCTETEQTQLRCITDGRDDDWVEEQNFPLAHKIVLGLSSKALVTELDENPRAVEVTDSQNRSALDWATARAQLADMALLLKRGADPNNMDVTGRTPVLHAVDSHNIESLRLILEAGGDPNPVYPKGMFRSSPLTAAGFAGMPELLKLLLDFEADPNACNPEGLTALHSIARTHNTDCALLLLEYGADLNAMSSHGRTPLTTAIVHNNHPVLQLFVDRCWDYMIVPEFNGESTVPLCLALSHITH